MFRVVERHRNQVDLVTFKTKYWPVLSRVQSPMFKGFEPGIVFAEIMGVIKGFSSSSSNFRHLTRGEYKALRARVAPNFSEKRDHLYILYEHYEAMKEIQGERDGVDRVLEVMKELKNGDQLRRRLHGFLHEIYVDGTVCHPPSPVVD